LVTDDCSCVDTFEILVKFAQTDNRVRPVRRSLNGGAAVSRNESLERASGLFVAFIDADDLWLPNKLEKQLLFMRSGIDFSFTSYSIIYNDGSSSGKVVDHLLQREFTYHDMLKKSATLGCSTVVLRRSAFPFLRMPLLRTGQDYALWLSLLRSGVIAHLLPCSLTKYRITPGSISRNKFRKALRQWMIYREIEEISFFRSLFYFFFYAWRAVFRR